MCLNEFDCSHPCVSGPKCHEMLQERAAAGVGAPGSCRQRGREAACTQVSVAARANCDFLHTVGVIKQLLDEGQPDNFTFEQESIREV